MHAIRDFDKHFADVKDEDRTDLEIQQIQDMAAVLQKLASVPTQDHGKGGPFLIEHTCTCRYDGCAFSFDLDMELYRKCEWTIVVSVDLTAQDEGWTILSGPEHPDFHEVIMMADTPRAAGIVTMLLSSLGMLKLALHPLTP